MVKLAREVPELEGLVGGVEGLLLGLTLLVEDEVNVARDVPELEGLLVGVGGLLVDLEVLVDDEVKLERAPVEATRELGVVDLVAGVVDLLVGVEGLLVDLELLEEEGRLRPIVWFLDDVLSLSSSRQMSSCRNKETIVEYSAHKSPK